MVSLATIAVFVGFVLVFVAAAYMTVWSSPTPSDDQDRDYTYADQKSGDENEVDGSQNES